MDNKIREREREFKEIRDRSEGYASFYSGNSVFLATTPRNVLVENREQCRETLKKMGKNYERDVPGGSFNYLVAEENLNFIIDAIDEELGGRK